MIILKQLRPLLTLVLLCCIVSLSFATSYTFTNGGGDKLWSNPANWSPSGTPGSSDDAIINNSIVDVDIDINVNSLSIDGNTDLTFNHPGISYIGTLNLAKGELKSTHKIIITDGLHWTGNSEMHNTADIELTATAVSTISGSSNRNLYANLINKGNLTHTGGSIRFHTGGGIVNTGTFNTNGSAMLIDLGGTGFSNEGTFNKSGNSSLGFFAAFNLKGSSQLNVNEGTIQLLAGGTYNSGTTINIASGAFLDLSSGTFTLAAGNIIAGAGNLKFSGGTSTIESNFNLTGTTEVTGGTANFNGVSPYDFQTLSISGGTLQGNAPLQVLSKLNWSNTSTIHTSNTLTIESTATGLIFGNGNKNLSSSIINEGLISHTGGNLNYNTNGKITNKGSMTVNGPSFVYDSGGDGLINEGSFDHQRNNTLNFYADFENTTTGSIKGKGTLAFSKLTNQGTVIADLDYGTIAFVGDYKNGNNLTVEFDGTTHGDVSVNGNITLSGHLDIDYTGSVPDGSYTILSTSGGSISGKFDTENIPPNLSLVYNANSVSLETAALPVELSFFKITNQTKDILLTWQTVSESNSDHFVIEHSTDGRSYYRIGQVGAAGFSNEIIHYSFLHKKPTNGENYYRLKQVDWDGSFEYSDIRVSSFYNFEKKLSVFPNPTQGSVIIKNQSESVYTLQVIDLNGKIVYQRFNVTTGATMLDLSTLAKGMYTMKFFDEVFSHEEKLMILE